MKFKLLRSVLGLPTMKLINGRPIPPGANGWNADVVKHDRDLSAGIFSQKSKRKLSKWPRVQKIIVWKSFRLRKTGKWIVTTTLHPDEIDPALRLLEECRRQLVEV